MPSTSELFKVKKGRMLWVLPVSIRIPLCGPLTEFKGLTLSLRQFGVCLFVSFTLSEGPVKLFFFPPLPFPVWNIVRASHLPIIVLSLHELETQGEDSPRHFFALPLERIEHSDSQTPW